MNVLVTGGAGYIGSHAAYALARAGHRPVLFDSLELGHREVAQRLELPLVVGDLADRAAIEGVLRDFDIQAVMHFAAYAIVPESIARPDRYYRNNLGGTLSLLEAMVTTGVKQIVFSSSCATYGEPTTATLAEDHPQRPINPYGWSKWMGEQLLRDFEVGFGVRHVALRYFNAAGCSQSGLLGEDHEPETHLIPAAMQAALGQRDRLVVFGADYGTPDGTCIRDFIHVDDLAHAHVLALSYLAEGRESAMVNVGTGQGHSVREVIHAIEAVAGRKVPVEMGPRRPGDPARLVAHAEKIGRLLGWKPECSDLRQIVETAWRWFDCHGGRYQCSVP